MSKVIILYIGNKNYSSWSLRAWLTLKLTHLPFEEVQIPLYTDSSKIELLKVSPSGKVPCLHDGNIIVWDTLAIVEYLHEKFPEKILYPLDPLLRSIARSSIAEMHSSFFDLRTECPMNIRRNQQKNISQNTLEDLKRIFSIWDHCKKMSGNKNFLLGNFSIVDAFFAPIVSRIVSYKLPQNNHEEYIETIFNHEYFQEWKKDAMKEKWIISSAEVE